MVEAARAEVEVTVEAARAVAMAEAQVAARVDVAAETMVEERAVERVAEAALQVAKPAVVVGRLATSHPPERGMLADVRRRRTASPARQIPQRMRIATPE